MNQKKQKNSLTKAILEVLDQTRKATNDFICIFDRPSSILHRLLDMDSNISHNKFYAHYGRLKKQKMIAVSEKKDGLTTIHLTDKGKYRLLKYKSVDLKIEKPLKWDGKWRIVIFDIPEKKKIAREILREKFRQLELYRIQDSVWVYPYDITDIIEFLKILYEIKPFVKLITANTISDDQKLRAKFNLY